MSFGKRILKRLKSLGGKDGSHVRQTPFDLQNQALARRLECEVFLQTDPGMVRINNQDRGFYRRPTSPSVLDTKGSLILVADGMGGASGGEVAAEMAVHLIPELYYKASRPPALALKEALEAAGRQIHAASESDIQLRGMGTTCVALAVRESEAFVAYVGDSRVYLLRGGQFYQLTQDHSVVFEMVQQGLITREQARNHEDRNVLSLSLGGRPEVAASYWEEPMQLCDGDIFLLCSDGLHDTVTDERIQTIVSSSPPRTAVRQLVQAAKENGGHDNITVALVRLYARGQTKVSGRVKDTSEQEAMV